MKLNEDEIREAKTLAEALKKLDGDKLQAFYLMTEGALVMAGAKKVAFGDKK